MLLPGRFFPSTEGWHQSDGKPPYRSPHGASEETRLPAGTAQVATTSVVRGGPGSWHLDACLLLFRWSALPPAQLARVPGSVFQNLLLRYQGPQTFKHNQGHKSRLRKRGLVPFGIPRESGPLMPEHFRLKTVAGSPRQR